MGLAASWVTAPCRAVVRVVRAIALTGAAEVRLLLVPSHREHDAGSSMPVDD